MGEDKVLKQDSPCNVLWKWFRLEVEKQELNEDNLQELRNTLNQLTYEKKEKES